jgi:hypothetical protein
LGCQRVVGGIATTGFYARAEATRRLGVEGTPSLTTHPSLRGDETMYARVVSGPIAPENLDEAIQLWRNTVAPSVKQQKGFKSARLLVDRRAGKVMSIGFWEMEPEVQGTSEWNREQIAKFAGLFSAPPLVEEHYEIAVEV